MSLGPCGAAAEQRFQQIRTDRWWVVGARSELPQAVKTAEAGGHLSPRHALRSADSSKNQQPYEQQKTQSPSLVMSAPSSQSAAAVTDTAAPDTSVCDYH